MDNSNGKKNIHLRKLKRELRLRGKLTSDEQVFPPLLRLPSLVSQPQQQNGSSPQQKQSSLTTSILGRGINQETGQEEIVTIGDIERRGGLLLRGKPRMGKSTLIVNLIQQDIDHGHGLLVIDPHRDMIEDVLKRLPERRKGDVVYIDPFEKQYAPGIHIFQCSDPTDNQQVSLTWNFVYQVFGKQFTESGNLEDARLMFETVFHLTMLLIYNPQFTLADAPTILLDKDGDVCPKLIPNIPESRQNVRQWWERYTGMKYTDKEQITGSTFRVLQPLLEDEAVKHIVGQSKTTINFREIIDSKKILLVPLSPDRPLVTRFIGNTIIGKLLNTIFSDTQEEADRSDFSIFCDEFQHHATPDFARLFSETGKWHIKPLVSHQAGVQLTNSLIRGTIALAPTIVLYQVPKDDAQEFAPEFAKKPTSTETRKEPVLTITGDPVDWFRKGNRHSNKRVNELVEKYLIPLFEYEKYEYRAPLVRHDAERINRFLSRGMHGELLSASQAQKDLLYEVMRYLQFSEFLRLRLSWLKDFRGVDYFEGNSIEALLNSYAGNGTFSQKVQETFLLADIKKNNKLYDMLRYLTRVQFPETEQEKRTYASFEEQTREERRHAFALQQSWQKEIDTRTTQGKQVPPFLADRLSESQHEFAVLSNIAGGYFFIMDKKVIDTDPVWIRRKQEAVKLLQQDLDDIQQFIMEWDELAQLLAADPIKVVSGYEEKSLPRTEQDMWNEMVRELVKLPRYTAYCKLVKEVNGEQAVSTYKLYPYPLPQADSEAVWQARKDWIIKQNRVLNPFGYSRSRQDVEQEIAARQAELTKRLTPQRRVKPGDDTKLSPAQLEKLKHLSGKVEE